MHFRSGSPAPKRLAFLMLLLAGILAALPLFTSRPAAARAQAAYSTPGAPVWLRHGDGQAFTRVPPPAELNRRPRVQTATFDVTYNGFDAYPSAEAAFQYAVDIWSTQITSSQTIKIDATWSDLGATSGILGGARAYQLHAGGSLPLLWHPSALADKLTNSDMDPGQPDIIIEFNRQYPYWYFGTDGNPPVGYIDFASVVLHEICHGLGFSGSMIIDGVGDGYWGWGSYTIEAVYDTFVRNGSSQYLTSGTFANGSAGLASQLTGGDLFFDGTSTNAANGGSSPKLYAPSGWIQGTSYSHWDESSFPPGDPDSLMTPYIDDNEAIHDPGPLTRGLLEDIGWDVTAPSPGPTVTLGSNASDPTNTSPIPMTAQFSEGVTGFASGDITVGNGSVGNFSGSGDTYTFDVTPTADGEVTVEIPANVAQNTGGDPNVASLQFSITYDTTGPDVALSTSASDPTGASPIPMTAQFTEDVTGFTSGDITVGNGAVGNFSGSDDTYSFDVTPTVSGTVTVDIAADIATDAAGNGNTAANQVSIVYDTTGPGVTLSSSASDPTNTTPISMTAQFDADVAGFEAGEVTVSNGTVSNFGGSDATYTFDVTPTADGEVTVEIPADVADNADGNGNLASNVFSIAYDGTAPTVALRSSASDPTNTAPISMTAQFSEVVTGFVASDITVGNGTVSGFSGSGDTYTFDVTPTADGEVTVEIPADVVEDAAGNGNTAASQVSITYDATAPMAALSSSASDPTGFSPIPMTAQFSEVVTGFVASDITVGNGTASNLQALDDDTYSFDVTPTVSGTVTVDIAADVAEDAAGNGNTAASQVSITYDNTLLSVVMTSPAPDPTSTSPISVTAAFSRDVTGFEAADIVVSNATLENFQQADGSTYTFNLVPQGAGLVTADIAAGVAQDSQGTDNDAAQQFSRMFEPDTVSVFLPFVTQ